MKPMKQTVYCVSFLMRSRDASLVTWRHETPPCEQPRNSLPSRSMITPGQPLRRWLMVGSSNTRHAGLKQPGGHGVSPFPMWLASRPSNVPLLLGAEQTAATTCRQATLPLPCHWHWMYPLAFVGLRVVNQCRWRKQRGSTWSCNRRQ